MAARIIDELELRDGEPVLVRPIRLADGDQLAGLHARLSPDSIYWRYFGFKSALSPAEIRRFTGIAEEWRFALVGVRFTGIAEEWRFALVGVRIGREGGVHSLEFYTELRNVMIKY